MVELTELTFIDCSGLSVLVEARKLLGADGGQLAISGARPVVRRLIGLRDLDTYLGLQASAPEIEPTG